MRLLKLFFILILPIFNAHLSVGQDISRPSFVIKFKPGSDLEMFKNEAWFSAARLCKPLYGNSLKESLYLAEIQFDKSEEEQKFLAEISSVSAIEYVEKITGVKALGVPNDPYAKDGKQWGHEKAGVYNAWDVGKGDTSVIIGIIDDAFDLTHPDLAPNLAYNFAERYGLPGLDDDQNGFTDDSLGYDFGENDNNTEFDGFKRLGSRDFCGRFGGGESR